MLMFDVNRWNIRWLIPMPIVQELNTRWPHCHLIINSFNGHGGDSVDALLDSPCLHSLKASFWDCGHAHPQNIIDILKSSPNLRAFEFRESGDTGLRPVPKSVGPYRLQPGETLPPLVRLVLVGYRMADYRSWYRGASNDTEAPEIWANAADWSHLKHLTLEDCWNGQDYLHFLDALSGRTPALRKFVWKGGTQLPHSAHNHPYATHLSRFIDQLEALEVLDIENVYFGDVAQEIYRHAATLRSFRFHRLESSVGEDETRSLSTSQLLGLVNTLAELETLTLDIDLHTA
ncbi:uncharacterized protein BDZ99DRAFT_285980 [Mytilinidion resinicola]|uniref:F-box domain-containing protein n=1 Tax=Mytilinidion resinicola TaxID=574789 RepID=A0A6A6YRN1_9PEZI|nr:uncharacterized protein BDZ99DRAFT_285980 [Mytilinidion resinicola]KAF2810625.1 hypothetical protein BDZ99DRAFT_285980 [Mytilinidion resinicola]